MGETEHESHSVGLTPEQINRLWEWALHEDHLFTNRVNFMLVAEAMLFAAFASLLAGNSPHIVVLIAIGITGIIVTLVWLYTTAVQIFSTAKPIQTILKQVIPEYGDIARKRKWPIHLVIGGVLPILLLCTWLVLIIASV